MEEHIKSLQKHTIPTIVDYVLVNNHVRELDKRLMMFTLKENKPGKPLLLHDEPIYLDDTIIGRTTSGNYSFNYKINISFGYINSYNSI